MRTFKDLREAADWYTEIDPENDYPDEYLRELVKVFSRDSGVPCTIHDTKTGILFRYFATTVSLNFPFTEKDWDDAADRMYNLCAH